MKSNSRSYTITCLLITGVVMANCTKEQKPGRTIEVASNANIHTHLIVENLVWPGMYLKRPMIVAANERFQSFKDHPAVRLSDSLLRNEIFYSDEFMEILLYSRTLPDTGYLYSLRRSPYFSRKPLIDRWKALLARFYVDSDVPGFLNDHAAFYQGAAEEVQKNLPAADFIQQMEAYYRDHRLSYTIVPAPEMQTGDQRGVGPYVRTDDGMRVYQLISASKPIERQAADSLYTQFGFDDPEFILRLARHEFGHSFVNSLLEKEEMSILIARNERLFTPALQKAMEPQNYETWWDCMAEHLVRLGEIRIAERSGDIAGAENLRREYTDEKKFIFLPELEEQSKRYEATDPTTTFEAYLPQIISFLDSITIENVDKRVAKQ